MKRLLTLLSLLYYALSTANAVTFPQSDNLYYDGARIIADSDRAQIQALTQTLRQSTGGQLAIATVPSLEGLSVEEYTNSLFKQWGVGRKGKDDGVLILVAIKDRRMRIEVGYGLEPQLPDALCGRIIRESMTPAFKTGHYSEGILTATQRITNILEGKEVATADKEEDDSADPLPKWILVPFFSIFVLIGGFALGAGIGSKTWFPILFGLFFGGMPCLVGVGFMHEIGMRGAWLVLFPMMYLAIVIFAIWKTRTHAPLMNTMRRSASNYDDGWISGANGSGGSSGGSSGGGGGSSGGGGASGSW